VVEGKFEYPVRAKTVGFSHGDFGLVVQALHDPTGNSFWARKSRAGELYSQSCWKASFSSRYFLPSGNTDPAKGV